MLLGSRRRKIKEKKSYTFSVRAKTIFLKSLFPYSGNKERSSNANTDIDRNNNNNNNNIKDM